MKLFRFHLDQVQNGHAEMRMRISEVLTNLVIITGPAFIFFMWYIFLVKFQVHRRSDVSSITPAENKYMAVRFFSGLALNVGLIIAAQIFKDRGL